MFDSYVLEFFTNVVMTVRDIPPTMFLTGPLYWFMILYLFWISYLAAINAYSAYKMGLCTGIGKTLSLPLVGYFVVLDFVINITAMSFIMAEFPREALVTQRLRRHAPQQTKRGAIARWYAKHLVNPYDRSGTHVPY